ncbi:hypothetical protein AMAG_14540 [Allomyces macrogynus ATCC 38327]|uniref:Eukaryotic translation initiation factor 3 subunit J n=1 Tax=Allomyces macrogynus (strain ATCC 38327) TaxID=578462 RepID=A0A0L0T753_ALLM3|nr:hypothetical protein AMAG_14540 [Allomyces macrogynus ATCC 38327]|eukprot:KNE70404.1 hypothetical protein AMAG_14540 [Allomyces macrogynus ATCC 38327]
MSDWEDYAEDAPAAAPLPVPVPVDVPKSKWDDEEDDDDVADAWDADSDDEKPAAKPAAASPAAAARPGSTTPPVPKKRTIKQAIAERQAEEARQAAEAAAKKAAAEAAASAEAAETPAERKARLQRAVEEEDAKVAETLFGNLSVGGDNKPAEKTLLNFNPRTKTDFDKYATLVVERFANFEKLQYYPTFLENVVRTLADKLKIEDVRKLSSSLNALANDKQRAEKEAQKKKKSTKKQDVRKLSSSLNALANDKQRAEKEAQKKKKSTKKQVRVDASDYGATEGAPEPGAYYAGDYDDLDVSGKKLT